MLGIELVLGVKREEALEVQADFARGPVGIEDLLLLRQEGLDPLGSVRAPGKFDCLSEDADYRLVPGSRSPEPPSRALWPSLVPNSSVGCGRVEGP